MWKKMLLTVLAIIWIAILVAYLAFAMAIVTVSLYNTTPIAGYIAGVLTMAVLIVFPIRLFME